MSRPSLQRSALVPFVARLIEARTASERDRTLLDAAMVLSAGSAAVLLARGAQGWIERLSTAEVDALPRFERVEAVLEGRLSAGVLPAGELVVHHAGLPWALALGGVQDPGCEDWLEALLLLRASVAPSTDREEGEAPPFARA